MRDMVPSRAHRQIVAALEFYKLSWDKIEWVPDKDIPKAGMWRIERTLFPCVITGATTKKLCSESIPNASLDQLASTKDHL